MRLIFGTLLFLVFFALAGIGMHFLMYDQAGMFIWSLNEDKAIVRTKLMTDGKPLEKPKKTEPKQVSIDATDPLAAKSGDAKVKEPKVEKPAVVVDPNIVSLFDSKTLGKWKKTQFGGEGDVFVTEEGELEFGFGAIMTGVTWSEEPPAKSNYEITLDAMKLDGNDFFCGLTFPVKESHATFVIGGWGGGIVGISSVDDLDASENETLTFEGFDDDIWYKIKIRVTDAKIEAWIDGDQKVDLDLTGRKISLRPGDVELSAPLGLASFITRAKYRNIVWKNLSEDKK